MGGNNIGEELTTTNITWGWFQGGFDNGFVPGHGTAADDRQICSQSHQNVGGNTVIDYNPHHEPFQYWASTANPMHLPPTSVSMVGQNDQANHQYDVADFWAAADSGNLPAVSYLKAPDYQDGHAGYSDPADEQTWLVDTINHLQSLHTWKSTAVVVAYDDSDGWYDHVLGADPHRVADPAGHADRARPVRQHHGARPGEQRQPARAGSLRPWPAPAVPAHLAVREGQLRQRLAA